MIMRGLNSASVDLIYLDPPFNSDRWYNEPIGGKDVGVHFKDTWNLTDIDIEWRDMLKTRHSKLYRVILASMTPSDQSYMIYMGVRLLEIHRILKDTGSIYLHCDDRMSHYLKLMMDALFGRSNYRNEITWKRQNAHSNAKRYGRITDTILFYTKSGEYTWNKVYTGYTEKQFARYKNKDPDGRLYQGDNLTSPGPVGDNRNFEWRGTRPKYGWRYSYEKLEELWASGRILVKKDGTPRTDGYKRYLDEMPGKVLQNLIDDIDRVPNTSKERTHHTTQKPLALLQRIIKASSNEGDIVLDPFCGCATTCVAAESLNRQWAGIDLGEKAAYFVKHRMKRDLGLFGDFIHRTDIPQRTDMGVIPKYNRKENKTSLYGLQRGCCNACGVHLEFRFMHIDHIIARSKGGTDHIDNLQLLCSHCNSRKGDRSMEEFQAELKAELNT